MTITFATEAERQRAREAAYAFHQERCRAIHVEPEESLAKGYYGPWDGKEERYFSRIIGLEYPGLYDGVTDWKCPDCEHVWPRFMESP